MTLCLIFVAAIGEYSPAARGSTGVPGCALQRKGEALERPWGPSSLPLLQLRELPTCRSQPAQGPLQTHTALGSAASRTLLDRGPSSCAAFLCGQAVQKLPRPKGITCLACKPVRGGRMYFQPGWHDRACMRERQTGRGSGSGSGREQPVQLVKGRLEKVFLSHRNECQVASPCWGQAQLLRCCAAAAPVAPCSEVCWRKR